MNKPTTTAEKYKVLRRVHPTMWTEANIQWLDNTINDLLNGPDEYEKQTGFMASIDLLMIENSRLRKKLRGLESKLQDANFGMGNMMLKLAGTRTKLEGAESKLREVGELAKDIRMRNPSKNNVQRTSWRIADELEAILNRGDE
jgi:hypothetical protein